MRRNLFLGLGLSAAAVVFTAPLAASAYPGEFDHNITGRVQSFEPYNLVLDRGPHIYLHNGTVIRPTGLTLRPGMTVRVEGHATRDGNFSADSIDLIRPVRRRYRY